MSARLWGSLAGPARRALVPRPTLRYFLATPTSSSIDLNIRWMGGYQRVDHSKGHTEQESSEYVQKELARVII